MTQIISPTRPIRPRRSVLYMPGSNERALEKAKSIGADALILDLEDAVAPDAKVEARGKVCEAVREGGYGAREVIVRINGLETEWGREDLKAVVSAGPDGLLVPKISTADDVREYDSLLSEAGANEDLALWAMMETSLAMLNARDIAAVSAEKGSRLTTWVMGTNDLVKEIGAAHTSDRTPLLTSLSLCVLAARAYGLVILDGVYNDIANEEGFKAICVQALELGFDGKTLIHPSQVEPCNDIFRPSADSVAFAQAVLEAFAMTENQNKGVLKVEGQMVELLHAEIARKTVAIAEAIEALEATITKRA